MNTKELAKKLCEKSGCHHKCNDTSDCVVEDEAKEVIANFATTLANDIAKSCPDLVENGCGNDNCVACLAFKLIGLGYQKQSNTADVVPKSEVIEEYRNKVYYKMEKYTVFGREYIQRIMREVEKEMVGEKDV